MDLVEKQVFNSRYLFVKDPDSILKGSNLYARLWSSSLVLHELLDRVFLEPIISAKETPSRAAVADDVNGRVVVLEVGSGLGITACDFVKKWKSSSQGQVPLSYYGFDFVKEAVEIARKNAILHDLNVNMESLDDGSRTNLVFFQHNWHNNLLVGDSFESSLVRKNVDLLIASDVLYMRNSLEPLARLVRQCLGKSPSSVAIFIDPGRGNEQEFIDLFDGDEKEYLVRLVVLTKKELVESGLLSLADDARDATDATDDQDKDVNMKRKEQQHETLQKINIIMISREKEATSMIVESIVERLRVACGISLASS